MSLPRRAVCSDHQNPLDMLEAWVYDRPDVTLTIGPRGGGKSFLSALATWLDSLRHDGHGTRILGGSKAQSEQVYNALKRFADLPGGSEAFTAITATTARFVTGSDVSILACSPTSVRGPHVPTIRLDEVDEINPELRDAAMGMAMARNGVRASVTMTSTWHNVSGPMADLIDKAKAGAFPLYTYCAFDILERCPEERSGRHLEHCPACPLQPWCHGDLSQHPSGVPKAKRSSGHYAIDSLIQKLTVVSARVFDADYLSLGPRAAGLWFPSFDRARHVSLTAEYDPDRKVYLAVDTGVFTGAVWWQSSGGPTPTITVFADYLAEGLSARANAEKLARQAELYCLGRMDEATTDPAGGARNPVGPKVIEEYRAAGVPLVPWDAGPGSVLQGLETIESFLSPADGVPRLKIHPRCQHLLAALGSYRRARRGGQWTDAPEDPQHPAEDLMDALRGGLYRRFGRRHHGKVVNQ